MAKQIRRILVAIGELREAPRARLVGIVALDELLRKLAADASALAEIVAREQGKEYRSRR